MAERSEVQAYVYNSSSARAAAAAKAGAAAGAVTEAEPSSADALPRLRAHPPPQAEPPSSRKSPHFPKPLLAMWSPLWLLLYVAIVMDVLTCLSSCIRRRPLAAACASPLLPSDQNRNRADEADADKVRTANLRRMGVRRRLEWIQSHDSQPRQQQKLRQYEPRQLQERQLQGEDPGHHHSGDGDGDAVQGPFVFTYDLGTMYTDDQLELHVDWYNDQYNTERIVPELMRAAGVATRDPETATLFFVPLYASWHFMYHLTAWWNHDEAQKAVAKIWVEVLGRVRREFPYFNRTNGRDHFGVLAFDGGRCDMLTHVPPNLYGDMFFITHNGDELARSNFEGMAYAYGGNINPSKPVIPCFLRERDIVVPAFVEATEVVQPMASERDIWFGLRFRPWVQDGSGPHHNHRVRVEIYEQYEQAGMEGWDFTNNGSLESGDWSKMTFAACPPGRTQWTSRPFKALVGGAIPVTFFRFHVNPFDDVLEYNTFSVNVDPDNIPNLGHIMQSLKDSPDIVRKLQEGVEQVQEHFQWSTDPNKGVSRLLIGYIRRRAKEEAGVRAKPGSLAWLADGDTRQRKHQQEQEQEQQQKKQDEEEEKASGDIGDGRLRRRSGGCNGRRIHMLQLPSKFNSDLELRYHEREGTKTTEWGLQWMAPFSRNRGFGGSPYRGRPIHEDMSNTATGIGHSNDLPSLLEDMWYHTSTHNLEAIFRWRMEEYDCLVDSHEEADWVYIPYYGCLDFGRNTFGDVEMRDRLGKELVEWLQQQPAWQRSRGADHFLVLGSESWNFRRAAGSKQGWGTSILNLEGMEEVMVLSVRPTLLFQKDVGVPYPTPFHPCSWAKLEAWRDAVRKHRRGHLSLLYVDEKFAQVQPSRLQSLLQERCQGVDPSECHFFNKSQTTSSGPRQAKSVRWLDRLLTSLSAKFCLHPWESACFQSALLESILAGCIPIVFEDCDFAKQFPWHSGGEAMQPFYMHIPKEDVLADLEGGEGSQPSSKGMGLLGKKLRDVPGRTVKKLRQAGLDWIPQLTYGGSVKAGGGITPPDFPDAFDAIIEGLQRARENVE